MERDENNTNNANSGKSINSSILFASKKRTSQLMPLPLSLMTTNTANKYDYPILEYQEKFKSNFSQMKGSLGAIMGNITNYKHEIAKLEDFLVNINEHEKNHKALMKKFTSLKRILEESIEIENLIAKLSSNQQIINISEYVNLHSKVKETIKYFQDSQLNEKKDFESSMVKLMWRGFKVYEESFYLILKRFDSMETNPNTENEKMNLLNKVRSLAECLQDEQIRYDFTSKLIRDRRESILYKLEDLKIIISKHINEDNYEKNCGLITKYLIESEKLFNNEKEYIFKILQTCNHDLKDLVYSGIIEMPLEKILQSLKDLVSKHNKSNIKRIDFYQNFDILNIWHERTYNAYSDLVQNYNKDIFNNICSIVKLIENFCYKFIDDFTKEILSLNEKVENENVLKTCNDLIFFLSHLLLFDVAYDYIKREFEATGNKFSISIEHLVENLIKKLEVKSAILEKKYAPLKYVFLINNVFFIQSKIYQKPCSNYVSKVFADSLSNVIANYIAAYLERTWAKVNEVTFSDRNNVLSYEQDGKTLRNSSKELMKKKFATFNEQMKINLKFQQHLQIIDSALEKRLINANIDYIGKSYQDFYEAYSETGFTKFRNKYIIYTSSDDVVQDLKLYFMPDTNRK